MAEPAQADTAPPVPEENKNIFILRAPKQGVTHIEKYLQEHGWSVKSSADIKVSLQAVITQQPAFFLICIDHTNKKVQSLPKLLSQALPIPIVLYTEVNSAAAYKILSQSNCEKVIYPPFSGPNIEKALLGITAAIKKRAATTYISSNDSPEKNNLIMFDREKTEKKDFSQALALLKEFTNDPDEEASQALAETASASAESQNDFDFKQAKDNLAALFSEDKIEENRSSLIPLPDQPQVQCLAFSNETQFGYLVIAASSIEQVSAEFRNQAISVIQKNFPSTSPIQLSEAFLLNLEYENTNFKSWLNEQADFFKIGPHGQQEVALSYFSVKNLFEASINLKDKKFYSLLITSVLNDVATIFDLYVYLPLNLQIKTYLSKGKILSTESKKRLLKNGMTHFYYSSDDVILALQSQCEIYLNDSLKNIFKKK